MKMGKNMDKTLSCIIIVS